ncbi:PD-(D/E)XK nuclease family protein, partial [Desulfovibrio sp. OttesenSCG-928-G11]|nr:PD-(D/E)XK nuclease family protein [Desulfovibrio sp. OttesenSCG-928-G11]
KRAYADPFALLSVLRDNESATESGAWTAAVFLCRVCLSDFEEVRNLADLARALERLCLLMIESGTALWERFPIDAECLYRLRQHVIPELAGADFGDEAFPARRLYAMLRDLLRSQRVPFEAEPLVGMQVLGMLESRLLSFERVIVLDATEEKLPGSAAGDPLLPEALRPELGLPPVAGREQAVAHNFFRLLHSAGECHILWRDSGDAPGIQEPKSGRSRFVQELLWEEEKARGRLFARQGRDGPLTVLAAAITPMPVTDKAVRIKGPVRDLLDDLARRPLSASLLDAYLQCPVRFFYERLLKLAQADEVAEGDDPLAVGDLLHKSLERVYSARLDQRLPGGAELADALGDELRGIFFQLPEYADLEQRLPADLMAMLREAGRQRLGDYLLKQPPTTVLAVEQPLQAAFRARGHDFRLAGKADRIDRRPLPQAPDREGLFILDYKSGRAPEPRPGLWLDDGFWRSLRSLRPCSGPDDAEGLRHLPDLLPGVQLPLYILICSLEPGANKLPALPVGNAMWVALGGGGDEKAMLPGDLPPEELESIVNQRIAELIGAVLGHLFESDFFFPRRGGHCNWCSRQKSCIADHCFLNRHPLSQESTWPFLL